MLVRHEFSGREELAEALATSIAKDLSLGTARRGRASLAVSGGSTPALLFARLSQFDELDWSNVTVTLVDERWVDESSDRSNAGLVRRALLQGPAAAARFAPLFGGGEAPDDRSIGAVNASLAELPRPFDAVVLGMGNDGHTASFFPGGDTLDHALTDPGPVIALKAPGAGEPRVTWTLPSLLDTGALYLHIEGVAKAETLEKALGEGPVADMPIRAVLRQDMVAVQVYWAA
ncbi:MAG: 6-phosphogluconolactonase [Hyphomicrobiaceae bacterium]|nr:6-phosphogluconolactonase [Hyphomicrobiaceae bacterium]